LRKRSECNSFAPGTLVLLADGSTKPIEEVELGDRVVATDPDTGESEPQKVVATIVGRGEKDLVEVTVDVDGDAGDAVSTLVATAEHPFWVMSTAASSSPPCMACGAKHRAGMTPPTSSRRPTPHPHRRQSPGCRHPHLHHHNPGPQSHHQRHPHLPCTGRRNCRPHTQRQLRATEGIYIITRAQRGSLPSGYELKL